MHVHVYIPVPKRTTTATNSSLERLMAIAEYLDFDPEKLIHLRALTVHAGSKASSASALIWKRTGENLGSILTELLQLMSKGLTPMVFFL